MGLASIEMSIVINGERSYVALPRKENPVEFNKLVTSKRQNELKGYLAEIYQRTQTKVAEMMHQEIPLTVYNLKEYLQKGCCNSYTIEDLFNDYLTLASKKVGVSLKECVYRKYELIRDKFYEKINQKKQVTEITNGVISEFYADLCSKYQTSTSKGMMSKLKAVINYGISNGKITKDPFIGIKIDRGEKEVQFLTEAEIEVLRLKKLHSERLDKVRDLFLFQCFSGISYTDLSMLTPEDYQTNELGQIYVRKKRQKTGVAFTSVLLEDAVKIAEKYQYRLPVLSNQRYNSYLKEIADLCNITKPLHTHIGRHTFGTYVINKGLSLEAVARMLGHTNTRQSSHYAKLLDETIFEQVKRLSN
jgi:site-specific recombinase XerD